MVLVIAQIALSLAMKGTVIIEISSLRDEARSRIRFILRNTETEVL